jgi:diguanylate cyclase (GGDEF)-like protein
MRVLVAEDDPVSSIVLQKTLQKLGYEPRMVSSGSGALDAYLDGEFRLVISDWMMPGLDGIDLCRAVREANRDWYTYFILITARTQREERLHALTAGVDDFLEKPLDRAELAARLAVANRLLSWEASLREANSRLRAKNEEIAYLAEHDELTGALSRRAWFQEATRRQATSLAIIDIDHFKRINDEYGHPIGDGVLREVASLIRTTVGDHGVVGRIGGEEFGVLFRCGLNEAMRVCDGLVDGVRGTRLAVSTDDSVNVTLSIGLSPWISGSRTREDAMSRTYEAADRALYAAKDAGRDRVCLAAVSINRWEAA